MDNQPSSVCLNPDASLTIYLSWKDHKDWVSQQLLKLLPLFGDNNKKESYFTDNIKLSDIQNKDTILLLQGSIIVELAELAGFRKQDDEEIRVGLQRKRIVAVGHMARQLHTFLASSFYAEQRIIMNI